jgi:hypothetical protein
MITYLDIRLYLFGVVLFVVHVHISTIERNGRINNTHVVTNLEFIP